MATPLYRALLPAALIGLCLLPALASPVGAGGVPGPRTAVVERTLFLMGTRAELRIEAGDRGAALRASEAAVRALEATEARLSTWGPTGDQVDVARVAAGSGGRDLSELARLNRAPVGQPVPLSPELGDELRRADACRRATGGAFDPGVGALVAAWGLRAGGRIPGAAELARALAADGGDLELAAAGPRGTVAIRRAAGLVLDEGAWGKGAGLDAALAALDADPAVLAADLDLGGQVAVFRRGGEPSSARGPDRVPDAGPAARRETPARPAVIDLADPRSRQRAIAQVEIPSGSVATSGNSERGVVVDGRRIGHLLDPRTGRPAPDFGSLTVWAPTALEADCLATGLYVLGPEKALAWAEAHPGIEVVVARVTGSGVEIEATSGIEDKINVLPKVRRASHSSPASAGIKEGAGAGESVASEGPSPCSPEDRGCRVAARAHEPRADSRSAQSRSIHVHCHTTSGGKARGPGCLERPGPAPGPAPGLELGPGLAGRSGSGPGARRTAG